MSGKAWIDRCVWTGLGIAVCASVSAEPRAGEADEERPLRVSVLKPSARALALDDLGGVERPQAQRGLGFSVVELPPEGPPGVRSRPRHALSVNSEMPQKMLRSIGVDATDCSTRFRMPTKVQRDAYGGSSVNVQAQLGLACRF